MKQIIYATDFSTNSEVAFEWAAMLAGRSKATLNLLHAYHFQVSENPSPEKLGEMEAKFQNLLKHLNEKKGGKGIPEIKTWLLSDFAADAIFHLSKTLPAEMVLMGTKGTGNIEGFLIGSITTKVILESHIPVWVIPREVEFFVPETFIFASNLDENHLQIFKKISALATDFHANVEVVHIQTPAEIFNQEKLDHFEAELRALAGNDQFRLHLFQSTTVEDGLAEFCKSKTNAVVCMVHKKKNFLASLFERSHSKKMALHSHFPLIVYPANPS